MRGVILALAQGRIVAFAAGQGKREKKPRKTGLLIF
jgi:hypothetical protein